MLSASDPSSNGSREAGFPGPRGVLRHAGLTVRRQAEVAHPLGLHMRPANRFAQLARGFNAEIRVWHEGSEADGKSLLDLLCLAAGQGMVLELEARGHDAEQAIDALVAVLASREDVSGEDQAPAR
jgi:phosphocarrier protein